jgi:transposase
MRHFMIANRDQLLLLPPSLNDWVRPDHPAHFVVDFVENLDLSDFYRDYETGGGGRPAYDPLMMIAILLYASMLGISSSRKIERLLTDDVGFRFISGNLCPDHDTIAEFRKRHRQRIRLLFVGGVQLALKAGLVRLGHVAVDGTKVRAYAAQSKRQSREELQQETNRIKQLVGQYLQECDETDEREDAEFGKGNNGYLLPDYLRDAEQRKKWIADSLKELSGESEPSKEKPPNKPSSTSTKKLKKKLQKLQKAGAALQEQIETAKQSDPTGRLKRERERKRGTPDVPKVNVTDPDCRKMLFADRVYREGYNCQIAVDDEVGIIVAADVTQEANDLQQLLPMTLKIQENTGWLPDNVSADTGYFALAQLSDQRVKSVEFYVAPRAKGPKERDDTKSQSMRDKLDTELGKRMYAARKTIVEPVFGAIKHARQFRQLYNRGKSMVTAEWLLWCTGHNLLKLFNSGLVPA